MRLLGLFCFIILLCFPASAELLKTETFVLSNGMQVVAIENHRAPVVTHMVWYKTGSIDDPLGKGGIAHVLEHMMFKGTSNVPDGEFSQIVARNGGQENAFTSYDYTGYYQSIARDRLELVMFMESDRMKNLRFLDKDFNPELEVVKEERLMRVENNPSGLLAERKQKLLWGEHPYGRPIIGTKKELDSLTLKDAQQFYQAYYAPDNSILVVAGDITAEELKPLAEKYYGKIAPSRTAAVKRLFPAVPLNKGRIEMKHPQAKIHTMVRDYVVPSYLSEGKEKSFSYAVLSEVLGASHVGKLYKLFINQKKTANYIGTGYNGFALDKGTFSIYVIAKEGNSLSSVEKELDGFFNSSFLNKNDIEKAKKRLIAGMEYLNDNPETAANVLGKAYVLGMTVDDIREWTDNIEKVTLDDVRLAFKEMQKNAPTVTTYLMPEEKTQ